jgi:hypothetical protein
VRHEDDFVEYVAARWPALVRQAVALGCPPDRAEDATRVVLTTCLSEWSRARDEADPDLHVQRVLRQHLTGGRRAGRPAAPVGADVLTEISVGPAPVERILAEARASRRRRTKRAAWVAVGLTAAVALTSEVAHSTGLFATLSASAEPTNSQVGNHPPLAAPVAHAGSSRANGRAVAAALGYAVAQVAGGGQSDFAGQDWSGGGARRQTYAQLVWTPDRGGASVVRLVLQPPGAVAPETCAGRSGCAQTTIDGGGVVTTWTEQDVQAPRSVTRYAELRRPNGLAVRAESTNAIETGLLPHDPVLLSTGQLTRVVSEPWWGLRLPGTFFTDGGHLSAYIDLSLAEPTYPTASP